MKPSNNIFFIVTVLLMFVTTFAQEAIDVNVQGISNGKRDSKQQDRDEAILDAKLKAIERAGVSIEAVTQMEDFKLKKDWVESNVNAVILPGFEIMDVGYGEDSLYHVVLIGKIAQDGEPEEKLNVSEFSATEWFNKGLNANTAKNLDEEIEYYNYAIEVDSSYHLAYINRGRAFNDKGKYELAIKDLNKAIELDSSVCEAYYNRGISYYFKKEYKTAINDNGKAIEVNPNYHLAYINRGVCYYNLKDYEKAIIDYIKVTKLVPKYMNAHYYLGLAYRDKGDIKNAKKYFKKAKKLGSPHAQTELNKLK